MPFKHKLSRRLALIRGLSFAGLVALVAGCMDGGPLGSDLDSPGTASPVVGILATSDNPTVAPNQPTPVRAVAVTADGGKLPVEADWVALDGGELRDTVVNSKHLTYFSAKEPGDYRLVSFDRGKKFRDTTRITVPKANSVSIAKIYILPAVVSLTVGQGQQFFVYGRTSAGDSVPVVATLDAPGGSASGLYYVAGDTAGSYSVVAKQHGGSLTASASVNIAAPASAPITTQPTTGVTPSPTDSTSSSGSETTTVDSTALVPVAPAPTAGPVELPRVTVDRRYVPPTGNTIVVPAGGDLQAALNAAKRGDVIQLAAGATFTGNFVLPAKSGTGVVILTSATALPPEGTRITPAAAANFARIVTPNSMPALRTAESGSAGHFRLMGLDVTSSASMTYSLVQLHNGSAHSVDEVPEDIILDRMYVHGQPAQTLQRCVTLNVRNTAVVDSWLSDCHAKGFDSQAIISWSSPGPFLIENNRLEGAGENVMFGGADPGIPDMVPSDITVRHNYVFKPLTWKGVWTVKNLFELKNAQRVLVTENVFENNWADAQTGFAVVMKSQNQSGACNWCVTQDVTWRSNMIINSPGGFNLAGTQTYSGGTAIPAGRMLIEQTVFQDVALAAQPGARIVFQILGGVHDITIANNTAMPEDKIFLFDEQPVERIIVRDNIFSRGRYGIYGSSYGEGANAWNHYVLDGSIVNNVIVSAPASIYPPNNQYPSGVLSAGLTLDGSGNYYLAGSSTGADLLGVLSGTGLR